MIAALPMYDRPETQAAHDALWALIRDGLRARGIAAPDSLDRDTGHMEGWARPGLVLSQICNLPWRARFRGRVTLIGAADYGLPGVPPGYYDSVFIARADDPATVLTDCAGYRFAFNEPLSNSGWGMASQHAAALGLTLRPTLRTGSHLASLAAVAEGHADLAALDAVSWRNMVRWDRAAAAVRVLARTPVQPGMTFVAAAGADPAPRFAAIAAAIAALPAPHGDTLGLRGVVALPAAAYDLPMPPSPETMGSPGPGAASN